MNDDEDEYDTGKSCMDLESEESTLAATKRRRAQTQKESKERKKAKDTESEKEANFSISLFDQDQLNFFSQSIAAGGLVRKSGKWSKVMF